MADKETLLVTTDLSEESFRALDAAIQLAQRLGARLSVLSIVEDPAAFTMNELYGAGNVFADLQRIREEAASETEKRLCERTAGLPEELETSVSVITAGRVAEAIIDHAKKAGASMIVMATHGRTGLSHVLLGSTTERVVRLSEIPVLTIRVPKG